MGLIELVLGAGLGAGGLYAWNELQKKEAQQKMQMQYQQQLFLSPQPQKPTTQQIIESENFLL